jgi:hypothetical protein
LVDGPHIFHSDDDEIPFILILPSVGWVIRLSCGAGSRGVTDPSVLNRAGVFPVVIETRRRQPGAVASEVFRRGRRNGLYLDPSFSFYMEGFWSGAGSRIALEL